MLDGTTVGRAIFRAADEEDTFVIYNAIKDSAAECGAEAASMIAACCVILGEEVADAPLSVPLLEGLIALIKKCAAASVEPAEEDGGE